MHWQRIAYALALLVFLFFTVRAIQAHSYLGVIMTFTANPATELMSIDLIFSLILVSIWMVLDARKKNNAYVPFLLLTMLFGVAGPLLYLVLREFSIKTQRLEALFVLLALSIYSAITWPLADLSKTTTAHSLLEMEQKGRHLLEAAAQAQGLEAWRAHQTLSIQARDRWHAGSWWPTADQSFEMHMVNGTFTSQVTLLNGPAAGETWGLQAWTAYRKPPGAANATPVDEPAPEIDFYLPTLHYFSELPFRLLDATEIRYQGQENHRGQDYDLVLATWGEHQPNPGFDQYQLWIHQKTQRIHMVHYTVRDATQLFSGWQRTMMDTLAVGTIHFEDYREVDGVWLPFVHTITLQPPQLTRYPLARHYFHRMEISAAHFNRKSPAELMPLSLEATPADRKPSTPAT